MNIKTVKLFRVNGKTFIATDNIENVFKIFETLNSGYEQTPEITSIERVGDKNDGTFLNVVLAHE